MSGPVDTETGIEEAAIAGARPDDPAGQVLARARVEAALFGTASGFGRFHVLERLGRGGMGVVYAAYDPELDRGVALKMIHVPEGGRELAVAEAKALARLSHPNVVPVFDVGVIEERVYIVMELVRGATLRAWAPGKPQRAIVEVYLQAGAALAAAHAAGLVHRDFKPDNAIVGADGRVRVVDFGLACETAEAAPEPRAAASGDPAPRRAAGTPGYMAPEQAGGTITPAVDQFSFCVSLDEALRGAGAPPPRWLAEIVERGRAADPARRFPAMSDLLRALGRDPSRVWRRRIAVGVLAAATSAAFLAGRGRAADEPAPCSGGAAEIAAAWPRMARDVQLARIAGFGAYGGELAGRIAARIDEHAGWWAADHRDACLAHRRGVQSAALLDRRMACLARSRAALAAVAEIVAAASAPTLPEVARAATAIPDPRACAGVVADDDVEPPSPVIAPRVAALRGALDRALVQLAAGRATVAREAARAAAGELRALGYAPLLAEALLVEGRTSMRTEPPAAVAALRSATTTAFAGRVDAIAVEAWARRAWVEGTSGAPDAALAEHDVVEAIAARPRTPAFARALLHNNFGAIELARGRRGEARAWFERALGEAAGATGPGAVELITVRLNLALVSDDPARSDALYASAHAELVRLLGERHPEALWLGYRRATSSVLRLDAAGAMLGDLCDRLASYETLAATLSPCFAELADVRDELGDRSAALAAAERAAALPHGIEHPELDGYVALWRGDPRTAAQRFEAALAPAQRSAGDASFAQYLQLKLRLGQARALATAGRPAEARAALERGVADFDPANAPSATAVQRRLAQARAELALLLIATGGPPARIRELAAPALAWFQSAGAAARRLDPLVALTRDSR